MARRFGPGDLPIVYESSDCRITFFRLFSSRRELLVGEYIARIFEKVKTAPLVRRAHYYQGKEIRPASELAEADCR
jgi:hypothetical protein